MKHKEEEKFKEFLAESFDQGVNIRELRLSTDEMEYIKRIYPKASLNKSLPKEAADGKIWCKVSLQPPEIDIDSLNDAKIAAIRQENEQLKQELEALKRSMAMDSDL